MGLALARRQTDNLLNVRQTIARWRIGKEGVRRIFKDLNEFFYAI